MERVSGTLSHRQFRTTRTDAASAAPDRPADGPRNRVRPIALFVMAFLLGLVIDTAFSLPLWPDSALWFWAGVAGIVGGGALFAVCLIDFDRARTGIMPDQPSRRLLTSGPYRWSRNPQFVALIAITAGAALLAESTGALLLLPVAITVSDATVVRCEEAYLRRTFGEEFERYAAHVNRWIGRRG